MPKGATGARWSGTDGARKGGSEEDMTKRKKNLRHWTLILLLQLAKPQQNRPVTQSKQISSSSLNNGSTMAAFSPM